MSFCCFLHYLHTGLKFFLRASCNSRTASRTFAICSFNSALSLILSFIGILLVALSSHIPDSRSLADDLDESDSDIRDNSEDRRDIDSLRGSRSLSILAISASSRIMVNYCWRICKLKLVTVSWISESWPRRACWLAAFIWAARVEFHTKSMVVASLLFTMHIDKTIQGLGSVVNRLQFYTKKFVYLHKKTNGFEMKSVRFLCARNCSAISCTFISAIHTTQSK